MPLLTIADISSFAIGVPKRKTGLAAGAWENNVIYAQPGEDPEMSHCGDDLFHGYTKPLIQQSLICRRTTTVLRFCASRAFEDPRLERMTLE